MNTKSFLDQLLQTGMNALGQAGATAQRDDVRKYATGAAVGGVLGLLLGTRRGRSLGGKALKYGSVAALGALAWKAYQDHQAQQARAGGVAGPAGTATPDAAATFEALPAPQQEQHSRAMLKAMIAAAKSDGHLDDRERERVQAELSRLGADAEASAWMEAELRRPLDPADVAAAATSPELAAEMYLASVLMVDDKTPEERAYLDRLADALKLAPGLKAGLESRALAAR